MIYLLFAICLKHTHFTNKATIFFLFNICFKSLKYILINYKILSLAVNLILYKFKQIATMKARFLISKRKKYKHI